MMNSTGQYLQICKSRPVNLSWHWQLVIPKNVCSFTSSWDETINDFYYFNVETGETQWCHPLDDLYRQKVVLARQGLQF